MGVIEICFVSFVAVAGLAVVIAAPFLDARDRAAGRAMSGTGCGFPKSQGSGFRPFLLW